MIDLDNTLSDRDAAVRQWANHWFAGRGLPEQAMQWFLDADNDGYSARTEVFAGLRSRWLLADSVDDLVAEYRDGIVQFVTACDGAYSCLAGVRERRGAIAIVTNGSSLQQHTKIDTLGLRDLVDAVIVSDDLGIKKPDPRIFEAAAAATGQPLVGGWMVGDAALHDVVGAQACNLRTAWLHRDRPWPKEHPRPTVTLSNLHGLGAAIDAHR